MSKKIKQLWFLLPAIVISVSVLMFFAPSKLNQENESLGKKIRIVSLMPSLTQSIYYLNANEMLVGCTNYCQVAKSDSIEIVSSAIKPNIEKIVSLNPDLVLVSGLISDRDIETLQKFGIQVEKFISPKSFDEICFEFIRLGKLIGKSEKANEIVNQSRKIIQDLRNSLPQRDFKPQIFIQIGASPIHTVVPNTFMDDYIHYCGGINIASELTSGNIGREFVVAKNPDIIFIVTMGIVGEEEADEWLKFSQMKAVANKKIYIINSDIACQPTPITFIETLELMNKYILE